MEQSIPTPIKNKGGRPRRLDKPIKPKRSVGRPKQDWMPFDQAKIWVRRKQFKSLKEWIKFTKKRDPKTNHRIKPKNIPANPEVTYHDKGWTSWSDFLGIGTALYFPYHKAKLEARRLGLKSADAWYKWWAEKHPVTVPRDVNAYYDEWESWSEFLATDNVSPMKVPRKYLEYEEALKYVHNLKLKGVREYWAWYKANRPKFLPSHPHKVYKTVWNNWDEWLGKSTIVRFEIKNLNTSVLYIVHHGGTPGNVVEIGLDTIGRQSVYEKFIRLRAQIIKMYKYQPELKQQIDGIVVRNTSRWWDAERHYIVNSIPQLIFDLDQILLWA